MTAHPTAPAGDQVTYVSAHERVYRARGKASAHACGCGSQAEHWAYDGKDPAEWSESMPWNGIARTVRYSGKPEHYSPMCRSCHIRYDKKL